MFKLTNATGGYKKTTIIRNVSLSIADKEIVALLGRNGAGKTTAIKFAMGLIDAFGGSTSIDDKELPSSTAKRVKAGIGYVPQGRNVFPRLTALENIAAAAIACGHNRKDAEERALNDFPMLKPKADVLAGSLSGGQQQVLAIARALATKPRILILDEPTEGVQPSIVDEIAELIRKLNHDKGLAVLVAEQDLDFCLSLADRAYVLDKGVIAREATKTEILNDLELQHELLGI